MDINQFHVAMELVAEKKGVDVAIVEGKVGEMQGPMLHATKADNVRFHDDKSTYTGVHNNVSPEVVSNGDAKQQVLSRTLSAHSMQLLEDSVEETFRKFCGDHHDIDGKTFAKACKDCHLFNAKFTPADADVIFAKVCPAGRRRIDSKHFKAALDCVARKKGLGLEVVLQNVADSTGPVLYGTTKTDAVRFHDDLSTYTGAHVYRNISGNAPPEGEVQHHPLEDYEVMSSDDGAESVPVGTGMRAVRKMRKPQTGDSPVQVNIAGA